jgi:hypothetical protein
MSDLKSRLTPVDDVYPSCERTEATLAIYHIDPNLISNKLSLNPTSIQQKGKPRLMRNGRHVIGGVDSWLLSSEGFVQSKDLRRHIDWLLDQIDPIETALKQLQEIPEAKMAIRCVWWSTSGEGGPTLWPEQMNRIAKLNLECTFSFAWYGDYDRPITSDQLLVHPKKRSSKTGTR